MKVKVILLAETLIYSKEQIDCTQKQDNIFFSDIHSYIGRTCIKKIPRSASFIHCWIFRRYIMGFYGFLYCRIYFFNIFNSSHCDYCFYILFRNRIQSALSGRMDKQYKTYKDRRIDTGIRIFMERSDLLYSRHTDRNHTGKIIL